MLRALSRASGTGFALVGLAMTVLHLAVFRLLATRSVAEVANVGAFVIATQVNFAISYYWTWSSRRLVGEETARSVARRAIVFNGSAALGFGVNAAVFSTAYRLLGTSPMASALVGTVVSAAASFFLSSRVVFRRPRLLDDGVPVLAPTLAGPVPQLALGGPAGGQRA
ncbi:Putative flippase GtrA (transmembrane translocase of bactoprenol-linked glucose) [Modestobacter sp. DSM 44400]|uniref:GtrA family protein n=1 Tax=Modestobacter sp. DSM 44400 TaxID=1550230 RepID=UPI000899FA2C|nr:GtrA family protein [Modestobacter sp. DSM 44400]SDX96501.1 Putative flippase GtrA (transmembrane translocase of bactoprenol-linked glucose) [Modestobacter sp. DSM 44400]